MDIKLYAFQFSPNPQAPMFFRETMEECRVAAIEERSHLKGEPDRGDIGSFPIYECAVRMDVATFIEILNDPSEVVGRVLVSKKLIGLVTE